MLTATKITKKVSTAKLEIGDVIQKGNVHSGFHYFTLAGKEELGGQYFNLYFNLSNGQKSDFPFSAHNRKIWNVVKEGN